MQLTARRGSGLGLVVIGALLAASLGAGDARAEGGGTFSTTTSAFYESGGPLSMVVINPQVRASGRVDDFTMSAGWQADIVSGASVAVVDAPAARPDEISTATKLYDLRNVVDGHVEIRHEYASFRGGYTYGFENDYRSHAFDLGARTELFDRNTILDLTYARGFDSVCNVRQPNNQDAVQRQRMPSSTGCFDSTSMDRVALDVSLQTFQVAWTQNWAPVFNTQLTVTAQLVDGFQSNPYRGVWLGRTSAQEHHPEFRARYAAGLGARLWIEPLNGALQVFGRVYRDTWDVQSVTAELAYEQSFGEGLRIRARARYYGQTSAAFFSDDYARRPEGSYFTGDRELSRMSSWTFGGRLTWNVAPPADGDGTLLGFMRGLELVLKADVLLFSFPEFKYGQAGVPNTTALVGTFGLEAEF